ncbi:MAG: hypothetical protein IJZ93_04680 [Clostridia bacterium]|nr:hypothetical protein [Clostridia bacterium]
MEKIKELLKGLTDIIAVSGTEKNAHADVIALCDGIFDETYTDKVGNLIMVKRSNKPNAPRLMLDAHLDEIGFCVTEILDGGFLRVSALGGINIRILPSSEVTVCGKQKIYGVFTSVPPHLSRGKSQKGVPELNDLLIDTGCSKSELEKIVSVGDRAVCKGELFEMANDYVVSKSLDDRACACAIIDASKNADKDKLEFDLYVVLSAHEETGNMLARVAAYDIDPDIAIITDVNFARANGLKKRETIECEKGPSVDISSSSDRALSRRILEIARLYKLDCQTIVEVSSTGTNNERIMLSKEGVRTAVMSIPLKFMHSYSEMVNLKDIATLSDILLAIAYTPKEEL